MAATHADDLIFAGAAALAEHIRSGDVSAREVVDAFLARIERLDPQINAFRVVLAERARAEADQADARRRSGDERPLLGVPVAIKDDMDVAGEVTARGSIAHGPAAREDSEFVRRLREAGAVVIGKTNVPELMTMPFTETTWYGATRNPWDLDRTPGGSSGGSAAAVAAGMAAAATGTDGAGSIRIPAAACGLVGMKATRGLTPAPPHWHGLDHWGFETRTVADTALLLDVVKTSGPSLAEAAGREPGRLRVAVSAAVVPLMMARADATMRGALDAAERHLSSLGHDVVRRDPDYGPVMAAVTARYLAGIRDDARAMAHPERLDRRSRGLARLGRLVAEPTLRRALARQDADARRIGAIFDDVDVLVTPVWSRLPLRIGELEGRGGLASLDAASRAVPYPGAFNHTGQPAVAVPVDRTPDGFPLGVQLVGPAGAEDRLLALAAQLERAVGWPDWRPLAIQTRG